MEMLVVLSIFVVIIVSAQRIVNSAKAAEEALPKKIIVMLWITSIAVPVIVYRAVLSLFGGWMTALLARSFSLPLSTASIVAYLFLLVLGLVVGIRIAKTLSLRLVRAASARETKQ